jgi:Putative Ig domain
VIPPRGSNAAGAPNAAASASSNNSSNNLAYGGGLNGVGVTTGPPRVFLIFWGSQWGTQSTNSHGYATLSGDPKAIAPDLQAFFTGLGRGGELWSGVMTQYCQGVATGAQTCPASAAHVGYPTGGALAGVWADESSAAPSQASYSQLGAEAVKAANHFGNTTTAANRNDQYFIVSPPGAQPDGFNTPSGQFCAWHDATGSAADELAFTNMPYVTDAGASCGANFVNAGSSGGLDGVTIVGGHEYAETITDQFPAGGWTDSAGNEAADKCAWISSGQGASQDISLTTGSFAVQSIWANDFSGGSGGCLVTHPIITNGGGNTITVTNPGAQTSTVGSAVSLQVHASDSGRATLHYSATGLPAGLSINASTGVISGTPTTTGSSSVTVKATDTTNATGSASFSWTIRSSGGGCTAKQLLGNPGFETGSATPWAATVGVVQHSTTAEPAHSGSYEARFGGHGSPNVASLLQTVTIPSGCTNYNLSFYRHVDTTERGSAAADTLSVQVLSSSSGTVLATLTTLSNLNHASGYQQLTFNLSAFAGQTVRIRFRGSETDSAGGTTNFVIDDTALKVS